MRDHVTCNSSPPSPPRECIDPPYLLHHSPAARLHFCNSFPVNSGTKLHDAQCSLILHGVLFYVPKIVMIGLTASNASELRMVAVFVDILFPEAHSNRSRETKIKSVFFSSHDVCSLIAMSLCHLTTVLSFMSVPRHAGQLFAILLPYCPPSCLVVRHLSCAPF